MNIEHFGCFVLGVFITLGIEAMIYAYVDWKHTQEIKTKELYTKLYKCPAPYTRIVPLDKNFNALQRENETREKDL